MGDRKAPTPVPLGAVKPKPPPAPPRMTKHEEVRAIADARLPSGHCLATHDCGAVADDTTGWRGAYFAEREVFCTRPFGHIDGIHVARAVDGRVLRVWTEGER